MVETNIKSISEALAATESLKLFAVSRGYNECLSDCVFLESKLEEKLFHSRLEGRQTSTVLCNLLCMKSPLRVTSNKKHIARYTFSV